MLSRLVKAFPLSSKQGTLYEYINTLSCKEKKQREFMYESLGFTP